MRWNPLPWLIAIAASAPQTSATHADSLLPAQAAQPHSEPVPEGQDAPAVQPSRSKPSSKAAAPVAHGSLSKELIRRTMHHHMATFDVCFQGALERTGTPPERVVVRFTIGPRGAITRAAVLESDVKDREMERCLLTAIRAMSFPPPEGRGKVNVTFPFIIDWPAEAYLRR